MNAQWPQNLGYTLKATWSCHVFPQIPAQLLFGCEKLGLKAMLSTLSTWRLKRKSYRQQRKIPWSKCYVFTRLFQFFTCHLKIILTFIFNTSRALPKEKADFANIERIITCTKKVFEYTTRWKGLESLKIFEQMFVCFQSLFSEPPLHNSGASQVELATDCWDERTVSWTLALWHS